MRLSLRFLIPLMIAIAAFAYAAVPLADALMQRWFVRDLDARSSLIAAAVQEPLTQLIATGSEPRILQYFDRMLQDERLYALGLCFGSRALPVATPLFPRTLDCAAIEKDDGRAARDPLRRAGSTTSRFAASTATTTRTGGSCSCTT